MTKPTGQHTSMILASLIEQIEAKNSITLREIMRNLGERVVGMSILLFCIPNCLPIPNIAGLSAITGIPIGIFGLQMVMGKSHFWLPATLADKPFPGQRTGKILKGAIPYIQKMEFLLHPRLQALTEKPAQRLLGLAFIVLATLMSLPIPFGNFLPGLAMAFMAIGLLERDGLMILIGLLVGAATLGLMVTAMDAILSAFS